MSSEENSLRYERETLDEQDREFYIGSRLADARHTVLFEVEYYGGRMASSYLGTLKDQQEE